MSVFIVFSGISVISFPILESSCGISDIFSPIVDTSCRPLVSCSRARKLRYLSMVGIGILLFYGSFFMWLTVACFGFSFLLFRRIC